MDHKIFYRKNLPHYQPPNATLFITFRLAGSLPKAVQLELQAEAERLEAQLSRLENPQERAEQAYLQQRRLFGCWDKALDTASTGPFWLQEPTIAQLVADSLHYWHNQKYRLDAYCLMPNHAHIVITPLLKEGNSYHSLASIMHSIKRHTARQANLILNRQGTFWQPESYYHAVRDESELQRIIGYVLHNPVKAGLIDDWQQWPGNYCRSDM
jgi:REP element-mobilizing transposase RayT